MKDKHLRTCPCCGATHDSVGEYWIELYRDGLKRLVCKFCKSEDYKWIDMLKITIPNSDTTNKRWFIILTTLRKYLKDNSTTISFLFKIDKTLKENEWKIEDLDNNLIFESKC